jgi:hypothetical protein
MEPTSGIDSSLSSSLLSKTTVTNNENGSDEGRNSQMIATPSTTTMPSLAERMRNAQQQVREEYESYLTTLHERQRQLTTISKNEIGKDLMFLQLLSEYRTCIIITMIPLAFSYLVLTFVMQQIEAMYYY